MHRVLSLHLCGVSFLVNATVSFGSWEMPAPVWKGWCQSPNPTLPVSRKGHCQHQWKSMKILQKILGLTGMVSNHSPPDATSSAAGINHHNSQMRLFGFALAKEKALLGPQQELWSKSWGCQGSAWWLLALPWPVRLPRAPSKLNLRQKCYDLFDSQECNRKPLI